MINFKDKDTQVPSAVIIASLIILCLAVPYWLLAPKPSFKVAAQQNNERRLQIQEKEAQLSAAQLQAAAGSLIYRGDPQDVMARVLAQMTDRAQKNDILITAFRPQKTQIFSGVMEIPVTVQVTGAYPQLLDFLQALGAPESHVAVSEFQAESSGDATSSIAATIGISIYTPVEAAEVTTSKSGVSASVTPAPRVAPRANAIREVHTAAPSVAQGMAPARKAANGG